MTRWSESARLGTGPVLGAWAALFWFLLETGRTSLYLSTRTAWLVPMGAVLLTSPRSDGWPRPASHVPTLTPRETMDARLIALPVVLFLALPRRRSAPTRRPARELFRPGIGASVRIVSGPLDFVDVGAARSVEPRAALRARAGETVELEGFVTTDAACGRWIPADALRRHLLRRRRDDGAGPGGGRAARGRSPTTNGCTSAAPSIRWDARCWWTDDGRGSTPTGLSLPDAIARIAPDSVGPAQS